MPERDRGPVALISDTTEFAGAELYMVVLVERLRDARDFVVLLGDGAAAETKRRLEYVGADVRIVPGLRRRPRPAVLARLRRTLREVDPGLIHVNLTDQGDGLASLLAARLSRRPTVATLNLVLPHRAGWREALSGALLRQVDATIAVSDAVGAYVARRGLPVVVVKCGLPPPEPVADPRAALGLSSSDFVVGGIGRLHHQKGWDVLCRAAPLVREKRPDAVFVVIGEGPERERLAAVPGSEHVRFLGRRSEAAALMTAFDILVVPSRFEGIGLTAIEALYLGVPVVASAAPGLDEAVGDSAAVVPPEDPAALAEAILDLAEDKARRASLADRGRKRAHELFSIERMAKQTLDVYRSVEAKSAGSAATVAAMQARSNAGEAGKRS